MLPDMLAKPDQYLQQVSTSNVLLGIALVALGGIFLLMGWKLFKMLVIADALVLGIMVGSWFAHQPQVSRYPYMELILGAAGGLLLAALAWPLMKFAVSIIGALVGAMTGFLLWHHLAKAANQPALADQAWVGGIIGLLTLGLLAFVIFKAVVIMATSLQGSFMLLTGVLIVLMKQPTLKQAITMHFLGYKDAASGQQVPPNAYLLPLLLLVPAALGAIFQQARYGGKGSAAKPKPAAK